MKALGSPATSPSRAAVSGTIALAVFAVSTAAVLFRVTQAPLLTAAFYRLAFATLILGAVALATRRQEFASLSPKDWILLAGVGVVLGVHFGSWVPSLALTSVASSVFLVTIHPVFVALWSHFAEREGPGALGWVGILVALAGGAVIAFTDASIEGERLLGDLLAVGGALAAGVYFLAGRRLRRRVSLLAYAVPVYAVAAVVVLAIAVANGDPLSGFAPRDYGIFLALALVPMILGHTLVNWSLKYVRASVVSVAILGEPVGSTILAFIFLSEAAPGGSLAGGAFVLAGIAMVVWDDNRASLRSAVRASRGQI